MGMNEPAVKTVACANVGVELPLVNRLLSLGQAKIPANTSIKITSVKIALRIIVSAGEFGLKRLLFVIISY